MILHSAGILLYRISQLQLQVFLAHPGGPYFEGRDEGVWSIPKGLREAGEDLLVTARREFFEETGFRVDGYFIELGTVRLRRDKIVHAWALEGDVDAQKSVSNTFSMEWPKHSGRFQEFPEMDRAGWFTMATAREKISSAQNAFLDRLVKYLADIGRVSAQDKNQVDIG